ncbi:putative pentatricopeptide repeat-containing protein At1g68930 isoform X2 [Asparagus officinalis]|uniref:putative pentatricopeptide repeat-containing protein At1g68930 isoform X1 n=1 Tax=Asparagus officinalis TaxID=4686 RepID=UPI00098E30A0|nr:putative pentatricopeptide repeat-containing protein At1g68930 isoform X1 [Asparagus officinalis]XP_020267394.1 putative pentatricopeptide repeat-containing protein At1g68930 isoform X2 [Asparagus officinalis]
MSSLSNHYSSLLKLCSNPNNQTQLKKLHCLILKSFYLLQDTFLLNNLISSYSNSNLLKYARNVFDQIPHPNLFSYNAILSAYSKSGGLSQMKRIFDLMPSKDGISWNAVISGYAAYNSPHNAVQTYRLMLRNGNVGPNRITFSTMLILSSARCSPAFGRQVHCQIIKYGFQSHMFVGSPLVDMYSKASLIDDAKKVFDGIEEKNVVVHNTMLTGFLRCGMVEDSRRLFEEMRERDSISWTTMVTGLTQNGLEAQALGFFKEMREAGVSIDQYTFGSVLTACGGISALKEGKQIHAYIIRTCYEGNIFVGSALVDMYSKCRSIKSAEFVFRKMSFKNIVSWTAMIVGYGQNGFSEEAMRAFIEMERDGTEPDDYTLGSVISSCANIASLEEGAQFHCRAIVSGLLSYLTVSNAIVTLYGKCGCIEESHQLFDEMKIKDQVSWTALVSGYAQFGKAKETIELFEMMLAKGVKPDGVTFIGVLSACSRAGLVEKGKNYFDSMINDHKIVPLADHYTCMIDVFGRAGRLQEAKDFINQMPCSPDAIGWATLLSSCRVHNDIDIGKWAAESLLELEPENPASYVLLSSMYAARQNWDEVAKLRKRMREKGVRKEPGCSWIKYKNKVHIFSADDQTHPDSDKIYAELERLSDKMEGLGYKPDTTLILHDVAEAEKRQMLSHHSEKLAIAFGLLYIPEGLPIRVVKNLRVCGDCHNSFKFISKIVGREILVRDAVRFHKFSAGVCSCGDFW